ncbi:MAG: SDR family oxidoreductase [Leucobacter sp.]|nr:SDR family oxidoreductase [Leucobacter sp.]
MSAAGSLQGKVVAVVGGANGIGLATARLLAAGGARVAIGDFDGDAARAAARGLGDGAMGLAVDVVDREACGAFIAAVERELGAIDVLVNSAGVMWVGPFDEEPAGATAKQLAVNLQGAIHLVQATAPGMRARGNGHIVTIASAASLLPTPGEASYAASKHGVLGYLKAVRAELHGSGVRLSVVMPTVVETALAAGTSTGAAKLLQPEDIARAVARVIARPRFEVTVPGYVGLANRLVGLLPERPRAAVMRRLVPDQVKSVDRARRADYEARFEG